MRSYDAPTLAALQTRAGIAPRILIWVVARNRTSGLDEELGLWTGAYDRAFTIGAASRTYAGAGSIMQIPAVKMQAGLGVRVLRLALSPISTTVADLIRTYDSRFAAIEIHRALFSTDDGSLIAEPHRVWKGFIDEVEVSEAAAGGEAVCEVSAVSSARLLTRTLSLKRSDATQQLRGGDRFRRYTDISGKVEVWWGERKGGGGGDPGLSLSLGGMGLPAAPAPAPPTTPPNSLHNLLGR